MEERGLQSTAEAALEVFRHVDPPGTPLTASEVADELDCDTQHAADALRTLSDDGALLVKETGSGERVWWRPVGQDHRTDDLAHAQFRELAQAVTDYAIFVLDSEGRVQTWNAGAKRLKGYEREEIVGEHFSTFYTESAREAGRPERNLEKAAQHGRIEAEGERVRKDGSTFWADITLTALRNDDGGVDGYVKITRDRTERYEYQRTIERERERLEIMNRLIRHNILNGLNLVSARAQILQDVLPDDVEAQTHVETIRNRADDLSSLIDTMRTFMNAIVSDADHETRPVPVRKRLEEKVALARQSTPDAVFETHALPAPSTRVVADELIGEVFENLLSNAVVHNDKAVPRVDIWASETTHEVVVDPESGELAPDELSTVVDADTEVRDHPAIALHVADNGPGIDDREKEEVLERGVSGMESPGSGFGLYLVREMMDAYGGTVDVRNREAVECPGDAAVDEGTVFDLVFLRAESDADR